MIRLHRLIRPGSAALLVGALGFATLVALAAGPPPAAPVAPAAPARPPAGKAQASGPASQAPTGAAFVGSAKCRACHFAQNKSWAATRMAKAFDLLKPGVAAEAKKKAGLDPAKDYTTDPKCLPCHTTGHGLAGGFKSATDTPDLAGVQCEACHGAGSDYLKPGKMTLANREYKRKDLLAVGLVIPSAATCTALCHNENSPTRKPFDYETGVKEQVHTLVPLKFKHD